MVTNARNSSPLWKTLPTRKDGPRIAVECYSSQEADFEMQRFDGLCDSTLLSRTTGTSSSRLYSTNTLQLRIHQIPTRLESQLRFGTKCIAGVRAKCNINSQFDPVGRRQPLVLPFRMRHFRPTSNSCLRMRMCKTEQAQIIPQMK